MLLIWDAVEADFLRDYRITLMERIDDITWRLFLVLLNNLSPYGAVASAIRSEMDDKKDFSHTKDEEAANAFFSSIVAMG